MERVKRRTRGPRHRPMDWRVPVIMDSCLADARRDVMTCDDVIRAETFDLLFRDKEDHDGG